MNPNLRRVLAIISGWMLGMILIGLLEGLGDLLFPPPVHVDRTDMEQVENYLKGAPIISLLWIILAWGIGAFVGGAVATLIAKTTRRTPAYIIGGVLMLSGIFKLIMLSHPLWFCLGLLVFIPGALWGRKAALRQNRN